MGLVSSLGIGVPSFWEALLAGRSGIASLTRFDTGGLAFRKGGQIDDSLFQPDPGDPQPPDRATRFMLEAAREALIDARWTTAPGESRTAGIALGTNFGGWGAAQDMLACDEVADSRMPASAAEFDFQRAADRIAAVSGFGGLRAVLSLSCSSGSAALAWAADLIRAGRATAVLAGGYDALSEPAWFGLCALRTMTRDCVRPFDKNRSGTLFSEGAAALLLESDEHARRRGAPRQAELAGWAVNNNAHHMTAPAPRGAGSAAVFRGALSAAGLTPEDVDHFNAHGTGTLHNDIAETQAIHDVFGARASCLPVTAIKSTTGHLLGAAGSAEAIASILTLRTGTIPPTLHYETPDPECNLSIVAGSARTLALRTVLSNSAGIGGCNAALLFRRLEMT